MQIVEVPIDNLIPADYNPREMTEKQAEELGKSIDTFGMVEPIVVNSAESRKNIIIGGHQRYQLLKQRGAKTVPVVYVSIADIDREKELNLRLNKNSGSWDWDLLSAMDIDLLKLVGFEDYELGFVGDELDESEVDRLDKKKKHTCPNCGHEF